MCVLTNWLLLFLQGLLRWGLLRGFLWGLLFTRTWNVKKNTWTTCIIAHTRYMHITNTKEIHIHLQNNQANNNICIHVNKKFIVPPPRWSFPPPDFRAVYFILGPMLHQNVSLSLIKSRFFTHRYSIRIGQLILFELQCIYIILKLIHVLNIKFIHEHTCTCLYHVQYTCTCIMFKLFKPNITPSFDVCIGLGLIICLFA